MGFLRKYAVLIIGILFLSAFMATAQAQDKPNYLFGGGGVNRDIAGPVFNFGYAHSLDAKALLYTSVEFSQLEPGFDAEYSILGKEIAIAPRTGLAYKLFDFGKLTVHVLGQFGVVILSDTITADSAGGAFVHYKLNDTWGVAAVMLADRNSVTKTDFRPMFEVTFNPTKYWAK